MADAPYKIVATEQNFADAVVAASAGRPVLVDFWAPWCGPCRTLMPLLERIADDYGGRFTLAKVNTDEEQRIAGHFGIRSIPTVMLFSGGQMVEQFVGVQPEAAIRALIDKHLGPAVPEPEPPEGTRALLDDAARALEQRDAVAATAAIEALVAAEPDHPALKVLLAQRAFVEAANAEPDVPGLRSRLERNPADAAARHALASHHALAGDYATALSEWLELMRRDRRFGDDLARRSLLMAFDALGEEHELVPGARRRMAALLH